MRILITGSSGFVGNELRTYFMNNKDQVTGTVSSKKPRDNEIKLNISNWKDFNKLKNQTFDIVIHNAAIIDSNKNKKLIYDVNVKGTENVLNFAKRCGCKHFIQISSIAIYGLKGLGENITESSKRSKIGNMYIKTKAMAEEKVEASSIPYTILRLPAVGGKNDSFLSKILVTTLLNHDFFYSGKPEKKISLLNVKNAPLIIKKLIEKGPQFTAFNCTDYSVVWQELITEYCKHLKIDHKKINQKSPFFAILRSLNKDDKQYISTIGYKGQHFPNDKLINVIGHSVIKYNWNDMIREATTTYIKQEV